MTALDDRDLVFEVTGVPSVELLERINTARRHGFSCAPTEDRGASALDHWRLVDFGDGTNEQFVRDAHVVLLGRQVTQPELQRRMHDLGLGSTRLEILVRLALCPEGRGAQAKPVRGLALPALVAAGRLAERGAARPGVGEAARRLRPAFDLLAGRSRRSRMVRRAGRTGLLAGGVVLLARQHESLRQELAEAIEELAVLRGEARP